MFGKRTKYTPLPSNGVGNGPSKRRGPSSVSPAKKMMIFGAIACLALIALLGGRQVTKGSSSIDQGEMGEYGEEIAGEDGNWEGDYKNYESPPFVPEGGLSGSDAEVDEDAEEGALHILPFPHKGSSQNPEDQGDWSPNDMAEVDADEQDEPRPAHHGKPKPNVEETTTDTEAEEQFESEAGLTAPEEFTPTSTGPTSFEDDDDPAGTVYCDAPHDDTKPIVQYAIVVDAGSTGSRVHAYKFNNCGPTPALEYETFKALQPGLSSFAKDPAAGAASLDPLMEEAVRVVPEALHSCTPVEVKATAGLRLLPGNEGQAILEEVRLRLESDFPFVVGKEDSAIEVMDGKDEGVYAWITANYLLGKIGAGSSATDTMAVMDLGGASTQIVFEPTFPDEKTTLAEGDHKYALTFGGKEYTLYQHSYLGYGLMRARRSVHYLVASTWSFLQPGGMDAIEWDDMVEDVQVPNPCLSRGTTRTVNLDASGRKAVNVTMHGAESSFAACNRVVELVLAKDAVCEVKPCSFNGVYQPSILDTFPNGQLLALSYFTDRIQPLLAPFASGFSINSGDDQDLPISSEVDVSDTKTLKIATLKQMAKEVCAGPKAWKKRWGKDKNAMAELEDRPEYCLDLTFMHGLLGLGYELSDKRELVVEKKLRGTELGWALGASIALVGKASLTCNA